MAIMSDLPRDLVEEMLSRVPLTFLRAVRFTCRKWNDFSNNQSFTKKQIGEAARKKQAKEFQVIMIKNFRVYPMSINLHGIDLRSGYHQVRMKFKGELISLNDAIHQVGIHTVFHCDGLLLCITRDISSKLVVWNPCFVQTMRIKPRNSYHRMVSYALGYESRKNNSSRSHKILRFVENYYMFTAEDGICEFEIYSFESNSWKVLDVSPDWVILFYHRGLSLKGNTYWYAKAKKRPEEEEEEKENDFLICFDFTAERFGPRLPLPYNSTYSNQVTLSGVGEEQLAVLLHRYITTRIEIWVTSKIEPNELSRNKLFLAVNLTPRTCFEFLVVEVNFFIDQKKNVAVVFDYHPEDATNRNIAYIIDKSLKINLRLMADFANVEGLRTLLVLIAFLILKAAQAVPKAYPTASSPSFVASAALPPCLHSSINLLSFNTTISI